MCRVLAARLKHDDFKNWVQWELDGYRDGVDLPDYRSFHCHCVGHFSGAFNSGLRNAPIPESRIPMDFRASLSNVSIRFGVGPLKSLIHDAADDNLEHPWPADAAVVFGQRIYQDMQLIQAWRIVPKSALVAILSTVRNRILNFAIEIEASNPAAGEPLSGIIPIPQETVSQIFNTNVYGNVGNVASGHDIAQTATVTIQQGDFRSLANSLKEQGVSEEDVNELEKAVHADPAPPVSAENFGKGVAAWFGKMITKAAEGTWKVATTTASSLLTSALKSYYGF
jgi:hypothetical protein